MSDTATEMERMYMALADRTRLRLINLMRGGEICVNDIEQTLNESQPKISRHLAYLRNAGVVTTRREGRNIFYSIDIPNGDDATRAIIDTTLDQMAADARMSEEYTRLRSTNRVSEHLPKATKKKSVKVNKSVSLKQDLKIEPVFEIEDEINEVVATDVYVSEDATERQPTFFHNELDDFLL